MNKFDYRKLDSYKAAIDDGFRLNYYGDMNICIFKTEKGLYVFIKGAYSLEGGANISSENFEEFKTKVEEYFTEGEIK